MPNAKYPWDKWMKKKSFTVVRHEHFTVSVVSMWVAIGNAAKKRGLKSSLSVDGNTIIVTLTKRPPMFGVSQQR